MKIQCDVCENAQASVICCADEAALCERCDVEVHEANKLASKHQRLVLNCLSQKLPPCDICREQAAFIFCVEDRALFCQDCDELIHSAGSLSANHRRFLATGIQVALGSSCTKDDAKKGFFELNNPSAQQTSMELPVSQSSSVNSQRAVDMQLSDFESPPDKRGQLEFGEFQWLADIGIFGEQLPPEALAAAQVPQLSVPSSVNVTSNTPTRSNISNKRPRIEISHEEDGHCTVPDIGLC